MKRIGRLSFSYERSKEVFERQKPYLMETVSPKINCWCLTLR